MRSERDRIHDVCAIKTRYRARQGIKINVTALFPVFNVGRGGVGVKVFYVQYIFVFMGKTLHSFDSRYFESRGLRF